MSKIPYGYDWLWEVVVAFFIALAAIWFFYPEPSLTYFSITKYYLSEHAVFFVADSARLYIIYEFGEKITRILRTETKRKPYGEAVSFISEGVYVIILFIYARDLFFHGKHVYEALNKTSLGIETILKSIWNSDRSNIIRFGFLNVGLPLLIVGGFQLLQEKIQELKEHRKYRQLFKEGRGGSAQWASEPTFKRLEAPITLHSKKIILGRSTFEDEPNTRVIGIEDDAHMVSVGITGSGKSTTVLLPNLATYGGSAIVFDPKGELAEMTYRCRSSASWLDISSTYGNTTRHHEQSRCYVLDPFGETKTLPRSSYNILSEININSDRVREMLSAISDGCVTTEKGENIHFEEMAKYFIEGIIAHVLSKYPQEHHNLPFVFDLIHGIDRDLNYADPTRFNELLYVMMKNPAAGGLPQQVAAKILDMGEREKGSVLTTVSRSIKWMGDPAMRKHLVNSDLRFRELNMLDIIQGESYTKSTVYIVLPEGLIKEQMRWLRTLISLSLVLVKNAPARSEIPTLFILDEFPKLGGKIDVVTEGFGILRGYGIKLWAFVQNIEQLKADYSDKWSSMLANSTVQVFGVNSIETAEWVSETLGSTVHTKTEGGNGRQYSTHEAVYPLLTPNEVMTKLGKSENYQYIKPVEGFPLRLERCAYKPLDIGKHGFYELEPNALKGCFEDW